MRSVFSDDKVKFNVSRNWGVRKMMDGHLANIAQFGRYEHGSLAVDAKLTYGIRYIYIYEVIMDKVKLKTNRIYIYHRPVADNGHMFCCD